MTSISQKLAEELYRSAHANRWGIPVERFAAALQVSVDRAAPADAGRYLRGLHLEDLALACACADGDERAWEHFVREQRPVLYRAADALDPSGGAREAADSIYAELYGLPRASGSTRESTGGRGRDGERQSLFRYYHGRSSLKTWLRAVLAQRHVDGIRAVRRLDPLPEEDRPGYPFCVGRGDAGSGSSAIPRVDATGVQSGTFKVERSRSSAPRVLLLAGVDACRDRTDLEGTRGDRFATAGQDEAGSSPGSRASPPRRGSARRDPDRAVFCICARRSRPDGPGRYASQEFGVRSFNMMERGCNGQP